MSATERRARAERSLGNETERKLAGLKKRDLHRFLETDPRVREWLAEQLLGTKDAAEVLGVDRPRVWRWEEAGRVQAVTRLRATPVYLKADLERVRDEHEHNRRERAAARDGDGS